MKEKIKENLKSYLPGFILGVISACTVSVLAATYFPSSDVTYDNSSSGLESTNVQGAIDELYGVCTVTPAGEQIIENAGLEKDSYECRYFFTGKNPNNYITFNNETAGWRIISVECDGTIKIMRNASIGDIAWDKNYLNNWTRPASLNTYLTETYLTSLSQVAQGQIVSHDWSIGAVTWLSNNLENQVNDENITIWNGKIALPTVSEYLRTNSNTSCKTFSSYNGNNYYSVCKNTTWMYMNDTWWTLSPRANNSNYVFSIDSDGYIHSSDGAGLSEVVRPTIYLNSGIKLSGSGTQSDPFTIE